MQCAIVEVSSAEDATDYPCGNDASERSPSLIAVNSSVRGACNFLSRFTEWCRK
jgi:hypothetical protein